MAHFDYRHAAYCLETDEILNCSNGHTLKRAIARRRKMDGYCWVITHDYGNGLYAKVLKVKAERGMKL